MKQKFKQLIKQLLSHKGALVLGALGLAFFLPELSFALESSATSGDNSDTIQDFADMLAVFVSFLNTLLWPLLLAIGDLMDVDMIIGPGMESRLLDIWVQVRNLVNIAFVLVLLVVAFYNVLGIGGGEGELAIKVALPKIVIGLVLVNFTYLGGRVMLDIANVGTTVAFGLPAVLNQGETESNYNFQDDLIKFEQSMCVKKTRTTDSTGTTTSAPTSFSEEEAPIQTAIFCELNETDAAVEAILADGTILGVSAKHYGGLKESLQQEYFQNLNKNNVALIMAVNMGNLGQANLLKEGSVKTFKDLTVNLIFSTMMYVIYAISYVVLAIVLLVRIVVLWLALALSPIVVLIYVVPQVKEWVGGGGDFSQKVIKHLIAPIIIGFTLSMGYLLMSAWTQVAETLSGGTSSGVDGVIQDQLLISGIDDLPKLILAIASVVVVWMGVFAAAEGTYAQGITDKIKGIGDSVKDFAISSAQLLPILPIGVGPEKNEPTSLMALGSLSKGLMASATETRLKDQLEDFKHVSVGDENLFDRAFSRGGYENENPLHNKNKLDQTLRSIGPENAISRDEAIGIAKNLFHTVKGGDLENSDKETFQRDIEKVIEKWERGGGNFNDLRIILQKNDANALGLNESQHRTLLSNEKIIDAFKAPPTPEAEAEAAPEAEEEATEEN